MERKELESRAATATHLRGLLAIPLGLLFIATGLGNLGWPPLGSAWAFLALLMALGAAYFGINTYYNERFGRVAAARRYGVANAIAFAVALILGPILDFRLDVPVSLFVILFALAMLAWFALCVGLRLRHLVIWGTLLMIGLLPVWDSLTDRLSAAWFPIGVATIAAGVLDHIALTRSLPSGTELRFEDSNVGA